MDLFRDWFAWKKEFEIEKSLLSVIYGSSVNRIFGNDRNVQQLCCPICQSLAILSNWNFAKVTMELKFLIYLFLINVNRHILDSTHLGNKKNPGHQLPKILWWFMAFYLLNIILCKIILHWKVGLLKFSYHQSLSIYISTFYFYKRINAVICILD